MKIGITTHYYNSTNYGGNLQAYALCRRLNEDFDAEQMCIDTARRGNGIKKQLKGGILKLAFKVAKRALKIAHQKIYRKKYALAKGQLAERNEAILRFGREMIPHSEEVYLPADMESANERYDAFVTGSDQVWHPFAWNKAYRLDFASSDKIKLSYAASIAKSSLTHEELKILEGSLKDYTAVSVRESNAVDMVSSISPVPVAWVLDPVFLLSKEEWDNVCSDRIVDEPYLFCYFLGNSKNERRAAEDYAKKHSLKLVTLPYLLGEYRKCDESFGDERIFKASPSDFISLIKNAEYVFTDSFHAVAFSLIYEKQFFVFPRDNSSAMSSRITSILSLIGAPERYIKDKTAEEGIYFAEKLDYSTRLEELSSMKGSSLEFLQHNLKGNNK